MITKEEETITKDYLNINDNILCEKLLTTIAAWQDEHYIDTNNNQNLLNSKHYDIDWIQICKLMKNENIDTVYKKNLSHDDYHRLWKFLAYGEVIDKTGTSTTTSTTITTTTTTTTYYYSYFFSYYRSTTPINTTTTTTTRHKRQQL